MSTPDRSTKPPRGQSCKVCRFYFQHDDRAPDGRCHRRAPPDVLNWPSMRATSWCGEWEGHPQPPPAPARPPRLLPMEFW